MSESLLIRPEPSAFRRIGKRGFRSELPRSFRGYFADMSTQVLGAAPKYILKSKVPSYPQYIVKYAQKHGHRETLTEFFINRLGAALNLNIAHSGLLLSDTELTFASQIFLGPDEALRHGSLIIEDCFKREEKADVGELDAIHRRTEQEFYSVDFVTGVLQDFCGADFISILPLFVEMLVFDALVGSMDRHPQNWGVIVNSSGPGKYRFAPIFDTARSLLWSLDEAQIEQMSCEDQPNSRTMPDCEKRVMGYIEKAKPIIGPMRSHPNVNRCNHFDFVRDLEGLYEHQTRKAILKVTDRVELKATQLIRQFPFQMRFTGKRKRLILKILRIRAETLRDILAEGGA